ncbi:murein biosynthesis integral membrane protein MurJ [Demequina sp. NBRC 110053]|uniref:murein biosynthesis integral membrane protein MurJ n=1 Tax=Demequina sp. NBRC 110053 TaxID=1570342 RepID=UPI000A07BA20|nr:lipid II flippase MurJ [Demequina sp. NBRC 110053]
MADTPLSDGGTVEPARIEEGGDRTLAGRRRPSLGRSSAIMASGTAVSRLLGVARGALLVAAIGVNAPAANAYDIANKLPNAMFAILAAGVLNAALVPQIVKAFHGGGGKPVVDRILTLGGVLSLAATAVLTLSAPVWVAVYTHDWSPEMMALGTAFAYWCIPQLFFYGLYTLLGQVLNAREQFGPFMWAPVLNNVVAIAGLVAFLLTFGPFDEANVLAPEQWTPDMVALIGGVATLGVASQALILIVPLVRGGYRWRWRWRGEKGELSTIGKIAGWGLAAVGVEQVAVLVGTMVSSSADPTGAEDAVAGNAAYFYALSLYLLPHSLVTVSIATALFTSMARHASAADTPGLRADLSRGLRNVGVFTVFATVGMAVLAPYLVRLVLPTAKPGEVTSIAMVLVAMLLGLVPLGATVLFKRLYFVLEDARAIFFMHIPMALVWMGVAWAFMSFADARWWTVGVGLGLAASNWTGVILRAGGLRRRLGGLDGRRVLTVHAKALLAAVVAGVAGWLLLRLAPPADELTGWGGWGVAAAVVGAAGATMVGLYAAGLWALRVQEASDAARPLLRRLKRR